jgi:hypothetical protein
MHIPPALFAKSALNSRYMQTDWELICDKKIFDSLKTTDEFGYVLALARAVNALAYVHSTIPEATDAYDSPGIRCFLSNPSNSCSYVFFL